MIELFTKLSNHHPYNVVQWLTYSDQVAKRLQGLTLRLLHVSQERFTSCDAEMTECSVETVVILLSLQSVRCRSSVSFLQKKKSLLLFWLIQNFDIN